METLENGLGKHLIIDLIGASNLNETNALRLMLHECADAAGATVLLSHVHPFDANNGLSAILVLAESHISIHTWPEHGFAAMDMFMCGDAAPERCLPVIEKHLLPERMIVTDLTRGQGVPKINIADARPRIEGLKQG